MEKKKEAKVTSHGSLAILALGHTGLRKWREVVNSEKKSTIQDQENGKKTSK
jgi:hypothetical protein